MSKIILSRDLLSVLSNLDKRGHRFVGLVLGTDPVKVKKARSTGLSLQGAYGADRIEKTTVGTYHLGANYENMVNNDLDRKDCERNFTAEPLPWGEWVPGSKILLTHKGENYVRVYPTERITSTVWKVKGETEMQVQGAELEALEADFFAPERKDKSPEEGSFDTFKPVVNSVKLSSIKALRVDGVEYIIVH